MTEQHYPLHLRKIGEPVIAQFLEDLMQEIDTHEKMFLELCQVTRERDALLENSHGCNVSRDEHELLLKRFQHLLESDFIRSFDEYDPMTGTYKRDISEAINVESVIHCKDCETWGQSPWGHSALGWCKLWGEHHKPNYFCASATKRGTTKEIDT